MTALMTAPMTAVPMPSPASRTVVLAVHYQNDVLHRDGKVRVGLSADMDDERARVVERASALLDGARARGMAVVSARAAYREDGADVIQNCAIFRNVVSSGVLRDGTWGCAFHDGLGPVDGEFVVKHTRVNAFYGSPLEEVLRLLGATRLIIAGISTHSAVEHAARHAADIGFDVIVAEDACCSATRATHEASLASMSLIATIMTTADAVAVLAEESARARH
ncbi:nicotinamidase-related amidase [Pigmentiphaga litoralis]|uniref:Nicotinamidase-related amidase n=2 Tax=Pigmentiphaga litoralis TaxID=516702 RepID=A0A7Y9LM29_9BURK|nr:nicotinamidase-related amidase [Pigmentiphaga litoralis]NYE81211.1 nicotinamidase-related amidase [Pigmentiphaga litoralis]